MMGTILKAECPCGFTDEKIYFGAGMEDIGHCYVPALKNGSSIIEMKNIRKKTNLLDYVFYTENTLHEATANCKSYQAWEFFLNMENNLCPKCKTFNMRFLHLGIYD